MNAPRRSRQEGFTLLEILVALAVLGFLLLGLGQGVRFGLTSWTFQARTIVARDELGATERLLRGLIERMEPAVADDRATFRGLPGAMQFRTRLPLAADILGLRLTDASIGVDADHRLVLRLLRNSAVAASAGQPVQATETLLSGVDSLELSYWRPPQRNAAGEWLRNWSAADLPGLIRLRIRFPAGDGRHWPDIVAAPRRDPVVH